LTSATNAMPAVVVVGSTGDVTGTRLAPSAASSPFTRVSTARMPAESEPSDGLLGMPIRLPLSGFGAGVGLVG